MKARRKRKDREGSTERKKKDTAQNRERQTFGSNTLPLHPAPLKIRRSEHAGQNILLKHASPSPPPLTHTLPPGCLLQMYVILKVGDTSKRAVTSVVVSALTAGYASGTVSYDYDTDPVNRKQTPNFYGYVPDEGIARSLILVCMTLNSALLLLMRAFSAAMLMLVKKRYVRAHMHLWPKHIRSWGVHMCAQGGSVFWAACSELMYPHTHTSGPKHMRRWGAHMCEQGGSVFWAACSELMHLRALRVSCGTANLENFERVEEQPLFVTKMRGTAGSERFMRDERLRTCYL